ncbi:MAG: hypothetical protein PVI73_15090, partial [Syntrophobacterales bacterium]
GGANFIHLNYSPSLFTPVLPTRYKEDAFPKSCLHFGEKHYSETWDSQGSARMMRMKKRR